MTEPSSPPTLFSRRRHRAQRDRLRAFPADANFLAPIIAESLLDRLSMVDRRFDHILVIGGHDADLLTQLRAKGGQIALVEAGPMLAAAVGAERCDEDEIDLTPASYDLILWPGGLESVNDVPGALFRLRALLVPDGLLLGTYIGDGSLPVLRRAVMAEGLRSIARMHPQIDLAAIGNLLQRIGFALPVVDVEALNVRYGDWLQLVRDLRAAGLASRLDPPPPPLTRTELASLDAGFRAQADEDGRVSEAFRLVHFSGWAPHPDQPKPARRGSAKASLADALRPDGRPEKR